MLDGVAGGFGAGAIARGSDPRKVFNALGLNKGSSIGTTHGTEKSNTFGAGEAQESKRSQFVPPSSQTGGVDAQSLVQGLLEGANLDSARNSAAAAQSLYTAAKGVLTGSV